MSSDSNGHSTYPTVFKLIFTGKDSYISSSSGVNLRVIL